MTYTPSSLWMGAATGAGVEVVTNLTDLDRRLAECDAALAISDDALRKSFEAFRMDFSGAAPQDPFSDAYRDFQMGLYDRIAGKRYAVANEVTAFDPAKLWQQPFPFNTGSTATAGNHLAGIAYLLRALDLPPGARVLEFGPGWGNTTITLAKLGFQVVAVDVEPNFCELIRTRAAHEDVDIKVIHGDFFYAEDVEQPFDAIVFYECFHHCDDHMRLLRALHGALTENGAVYFASEPIMPDYPIPWGLRVDPEALWAIRRFGWLELGYDETYFKAALRRTGWTAVKRASLDIPWLGVWVARASTTTITRGVRLGPVDADLHAGLVAGWEDRREAAGVWSVGAQARISSPLAPTGEPPRRVTAQLSAIASQPDGSQYVEAIVQGSTAATIELREFCDTTWTLDLPPGPADWLDVTFRIRNPVRPVDRGINDDGRALGLLLRWIVVD